MSVRQLCNWSVLFAAALLTTACHHRPSAPPVAPAAAQPPRPPAIQPAAAHPDALTPSVKFVRVKKLADGLRIEDVSLGHGATVQSGDQVAVTYTGWLADGKVFDASRLHGGQPFTFVDGAGQVIKGWDQGLLGMHVGGVRQLVIPPDLGYGQAGSPPTIPPASTLTFRIHLLAVLPASGGQ